MYHSNSKKVDEQVQAFSEKLGRDVSKEEVEEFNANLVGFISVLLAIMKRESQVESAK